MTKINKNNQQEVLREVSGCRFEKNQLRMAECLKSDRDILEALLQQDTLYTLQEAMDKVNEFKKGKVR